MIAYRVAIHTVTTAKPYLKNEPAPRQYYYLPPKDLDPNDYATHFGTCVSFTATESTIALLHSAFYEVMYDSTSLEVDASATHTTYLARLQAPGARLCRTYLRRDENRAWWDALFRQGTNALLHTQARTAPPCSFCAKGLAALGGLCTPGATTCISDIHAHDKTPRNRRALPITPDTNHVRVPPTF